MSPRADARLADYQRRGFIPWRLMQTPTWDRCFRLSTLASLYLTASAIAFLTTQPLAAQSATFDAASIKPADPEHIGLQLYSPNPGSFRAMAADIKHLIAFSYNVRDVQISGGPRWADTELFDIEAKAPAPATTADLRLMLQSLLVDRFQLKLHREPKEQAVFDLVVARKGPKLTPVDAAGLGIGLGKTQLNGRGATMSGLAGVLSSRVGSQVIDKTGLAGFYNFTLAWTPDDAATAETGPSIFTALQEQLGLKLEPAKGTVEILVIDSVERPSRN
ncbi:MAG: TIGR03435 family protein [Bryobacteraceae bacterium]|jgi:uncharacterized protein (TIGR03435 family)